MPFPHTHSLLSAPLVQGLSRLEPILHQYTSYHLPTAWELHRTCREAGRNIAHHLGYGSKGVSKHRTGLNSSFPSFTGRWEVKGSKTQARI